ncbi:MAG: hypothetical protein KKE96_04645 [Candidatus Altiarchaeota archaeon]|nr:hypothetical protein [Candidatus Altiarchaeota archaeon]
MKQKFKIGHYAGNKWGGKFLRAPDIFYTILEKGEGKLLQLWTLADVTPGCYSGINDFFYLDVEKLKKWKLETDYIKPLIRSSDIVKTLHVKDTLNNYVLSIPQISKTKLKNQKYNSILSYINWGEKQVTRKRQKTVAGIPWPKVETVKNRKYWYSIPEKNLRPTNLFMQYVSNDRFYCPYSEIPLVSDRCFHRIFIKKEVDYKSLCASLNSTLQMFFVMLFGRSNLGQGALKFETTDAKKIMIYDPRKFNEAIKKEIVNKLEKLGRRGTLSVFDECGIDPAKPIREQEPKPLPDRAELDKIIFDELGLTKGERKEVYWAVCELVKQRLEKARSLRK